MDAIEKSYQLFCWFEMKLLNYFHKKKKKKKEMKLPMASSFFKCEIRSIIWIFDVVSNNLVSYF
jgi:ascorbate-specific PTS system EIIC-type component UlaA